MENFNKETFKAILSYGFALGMVLVIYSLFLYFFNIMPVGITKPMLLFVLMALISFFGLLYFSKLVRNESFGGKISYSHALLVGLSLGLSAAIITSAYSYIQNHIIDPEYTIRYLNAQKEWMIDFMYSKGMPDEEIEKAISKLDIEKAKKFTFITYISSVAYSTLGFGILSLITAAIVKKKDDNPFAE